MSTELLVSLLVVKFCSPSVEDMRVEGEGIWHHVLVFDRVFVLD
jgi:hypothetical protein